jgi:hypothetical protein
MSVREMLCPFKPTIFVITYVDKLMNRLFVQYFKMFGFLSQKNNTSAK